MRRKFNQVGDDRLLKAAQDGISKELQKRLSEGKPVSYYDKEKDRVYRLTQSGEKVYV